MGFFSKLFGGSEEKPSALEMELEQKFITSSTDIGMSSLQAKETFDLLISEVKKDIASSSPLPDCFGDYLLENEKSNEKIKDLLSEKRQVGVTDKEIRDWWNKSELERGLIQKSDDLLKMSVFSWARDEGMSVDESTAHVRKSLPMYGDKNLHEHLPYEWKEKIDLLVLENIKNDANSAKEEAAPYKTLNDYIREKIIR